MDGGQAVEQGTATEQVAVEQVAEEQAASGQPAEPLACCSPFGDAALTDEQAAATAALFRALGDARRVQLVSLLASRGQPACVCELTGPLGLGQPTVSHHLKKLRDAGLVVREQRGRWAAYSLRRDVAACLARLMAPHVGDAAVAAPRRHQGHDHEPGARP